VVNDQIGAPTWSRMIAEATAQVLAQITSHATPLSKSFSGISGVYHLSAGGETSWFGFAKAILANQLAPTVPVPRLTPVGTEEYPARATRPKYSVLSNAKLNRNFGLIMPHWENSLGLCREGSG
jgi:dTDP-4-dehydrorhamnose reductase